MFLHIIAAKLRLQSSILIKCSSARKTFIQNQNTAKVNNENESSKSQSLFRLKVKQ